ncbi:MAG TPA: hypothetical protein VHC98_02335 [Candidatus Saccharimonadales bacterium]|nr:hypothetical protein [Candidatus Saccharimonadales bacterium]
MTIGRAQPPPNTSQGIQPLDTAERARAIFAPGKYLARKLGEMFGDKTAAAVLTNLHVQDDDDATFVCTDEALQRQTHTERYFVRQTGAHEERQVSTPAPLERVAMAALDLACDRRYAGVQTRAVLQPILRLVAEYDFQRPDKPALHLPALRERAMNALAQFEGASYRAARHTLYGIIEHLDLNMPAGQLDRLVRQMDKNHDLDHPLAFTATLAIAARDPHAPWLQTQHERREGLLQLLSGDSQALLNNAEELFRLAEGLVYHGDPLQPEHGKVGMELECRFPEEVAARAIYRNRDAQWPEHDENIRSLEQNWAHHYDMNNNEITRKRDRLEHADGYPASLIELYQWLNKNRVRVIGPHLHFDKERHPIAPRLNGLLINTGDYTPFHAAVRDNDLGTYEVRGLLTPHTWKIQTGGNHYAFVPGENIHPARMADIIALYIAATTPHAGIAPHAYTKLHLDLHGPSSLETIMWGHLAATIDLPEGRLAALMALREPSAFHGFNPVAFLNTYDRQSLTIIGARAKQLLRDTPHTRTLLGIVDAAAAGTLPETYRQLDSSYRSILTKYVVDPSNPLNKELLLQLVRDPAAAPDVVAALASASTDNLQLIEAMVDNESLSQEARGALLGSLLRHLENPRGRATSALYDNSSTAVEAAVEVLLQHGDTYGLEVLDSFLRDEQGARNHAAVLRCLAPSSRRCHGIVAPFVTDEEHPLHALAFDFAVHDPWSFRPELSAVVLAGRSDAIRLRALRALESDESAISPEVLLAAYRSASEELSVAAAGLMAQQLDIQPFRNILRQIITDPTHQAYQKVFDSLAKQGEVPLLRLGLRHADLTAAAVWDSLARGMPAVRALILEHKAEFYNLPAAIQLRVRNAVSYNSHLVVTWLNQDPHLPEPIRDYFVWRLKSAVSSSYKTFEAILQSKVPMVRTIALDDVREHYYEYGTYVSMLPKRSRRRLLRQLPPEAAAYLRSYID